VPLEPPERKTSERFVDSILEQVTHVRRSVIEMIIMAKRVEHIQGCDLFHGASDSITLSFLTPHQIGVSQFLKYLVGVSGGDVLIEGNESCSTNSKGVFDNSYKQATAYNTFWLNFIRSS